MKDFKFLNKNTIPDYRIPDYNGTWSLSAVRFVHDYIAGRFGAEYRNGNDLYQLTQATHEHGEMVRCTVEVSNLLHTNIRVVYSINIGNYYPYITEHSILYDY